jgi:hypothetical protein
MKRKILAYIIFALLVCQNLLSQSTDTNHSVITKRIILIGDAGEPSLKEREPVLIALQRMASEINDSSLVIFLGDNIYPIGLTEESHPNRKEYERRIDEQIDAVINSNAAGFFIPGNHDWNRGKPDGIEYIKRQYEYVTEKAVNKVFFKPKNGCPGPEYFDFGNNLRIIFLDTQWWLQNKASRTFVSDDCDINSEEEIVKELSKLIEDENKFIVITGHHPLLSYGRHGGNYSFVTHLFPLTELNKNLYLPLPIIGSMFVFIKNLGVSVQDISNLNYKSMIGRIESVIEKRKGIIYASGHDHTLQALRGNNDNLYLVSGAGIFDLVDDCVGHGEETLYADNIPGFFMLDFLSDGKIKVSAIEVIDRLGNTRTAFDISTK